MTFDFESLRFYFVARQPIQFPEIVPANILRGAFGILLRRSACQCAPGRPHAPDCAYARLFEPVAVGTGPSGLRDWPRPFVFRARHLDGRKVEAGERFHFDMNVLETRIAVRSRLEAAFVLLGEQGLGPTRGRADLEQTEQRTVSLNLVQPERSLNTVTVQFLTPTELKGSRGAEFPILFARIRDRVSTLRSLYGPGPLSIDFAAMGARAAAISVARSDIREIEAYRRSARTGLQHAIGGFVGEVEYSGSISEFLPLLEAAQWTGVGRHTVWGNGELLVRQT